MDWACGSGIQRCSSPRFMFSMTWVFGFDHLNHHNANFLRARIVVVTSFAVMATSLMKRHCSVMVMNPLISSGGSKSSSIQFREVIEETTLP